MEKEYLIKKWLSNNLNEAELAAFEAMEDHHLHTQIIENAKYFKASHFSEVADFDELYSRISTQTPVKKLNWIKPMMRIAGLFILGFGIYFMFFFNSLHHVKTLASEKTTVELPDHSMVTLNALSEISFSKKKWNKKREVNLDGEAFFKVAKGKKFDVITSEGIVTVVGTQFNVKQRGDYFEVECYEGIVKVVSNNNTKELQAGDTFRLYGDHLSYNETLFEYPQWTNDISNFKSVPFEEVLKELERQFDVSIQFENINTNHLFTGGFKHDSLDNALKSITEPLKLTYKIESSKQVILLSREQ